MKQFGDAETRGPAWQPTAAAARPGPVIAHRQGPGGGNGQTLP